MEKLVEGYSYEEISSFPFDVSMSDRDPITYYSNWKIIWSFFNKEKIIEKASKLSVSVSNGTVRFVYPIKCLVMDWGDEDKFGFDVFDNAMIVDMSRGHFELGVFYDEEKDMFLIHIKENKTLICVVSISNY